MKKGQRGFLRFPAPATDWSQPFLFKESIMDIASQGFIVHNANVANWLPTDADRAFVASLMGRVVEPGRFANWIAPPAIGINRQPVSFEYVRFG